MQTYDVHVRAPWHLQLLTRNPLVRNSDWLEVMAKLVAVLVCLAAVAFAGAVGTSVYDSHHRRYLNEAQTRHRVTAIVTDGGNAQPGDGDGTIGATWRVGGVDHTGRLGRGDPVSVGDRVEIWVDQHGDAVAAPIPTWRAGADAVLTGYVLLVGISITTASFLTSVLERLARVRQAQSAEAIDRLTDSSWH